MTTNTNAEFIAECEEQLGLHGKLTTFQGVPVVFNGGIEKRLEEAIERLKRADKELNMLTQEAYGHAQVIGRHVPDLIKENAELKELLQWCYEESNIRFIESVTNPAIKRIEEILSTPSEGNEDGKEKGR